MTYNSYDSGSAVILTGTFTDLNGVPHAPTNVRLWVQDPNGVETEYTNLMNNSVGVYSYTLIVMTAGVWHYRFEGDGAVKASGDAVFTVTSTVFAGVAAP